MSATDGQVLGSLKIIDHGVNLDRWNLVILGDGYQASEISTYHADVLRFVAALRARAPFGELWQAINVVRVDVTSTDSGADRDAGGTVTAVSVNTYFDARYQAPPLDRLLVVDTALAQNVAEEQCLEFDAVIVIVNDSQYGGSGGAVAVCGSSDDSMAIAIHEMGHSAFGLADEYSTLAGCSSGETGHDSYSGAEPVEPNVTREQTAAAIKWSHLLSSGVPMPTTSNPDCTQCDPLAADPQPTGTVGAYEGAKYFHCGLFRPVFSCKMREETAPAYCPVCQEAIRIRLAPFEPPESILLTTPLLDFEVPVGLGGLGVTSYRAVVWEVVTSGNKTFRVVDGAAPDGFDLPFGASVTVGPADTEPVSFARLWVSYTSTAVGDEIGGAMDVECIETGEQWTVGIGAVTIDRPETSLALVLDSSGSMDDDGSDALRKVDILRRAAAVLIDVMLPENALSIVRFDQTAERLMDATLMGAENGGAGRATALGIINGAQMEPDGATSIGAGLEVAVEAFADSATGSEPFDTEAVLVITDGKENRHPFLSEVESLVTDNTFAVGIGIPADINTEALSTLTAAHEGYLLLTGDPNNDQQTRLKKYFLQIIAGLTSADVVLDPRGQVRAGGTSVIPFHLTESDYGADILVLSPLPQGLEIDLLTPDGDRIGAADLPDSPWAQFVTGSNVAYYRLALPLRTQRIHSAHVGTWKVEISLNERGERFLKREKPGKGQDAAIIHRQAIPFDVMVHAYSMMRLKVSAEPALIAVNSAVQLVATLTEFDAPPIRPANVFAEVQEPNGQRSHVHLESESDGVYSAIFVAADVGLYTVRFRALGRNRRGHIFTREQTRTFAVNKSGHDDAGSKPESPSQFPWRDWTRFLLTAGLITSERARQLDRAAGGSQPKEPRRARKRKKGGSAKTERLPKRK